MCWRRSQIADRERASVLDFFKIAYSKKRFIYNFSLDFRRFAIFPAQCSVEKCFRNNAFSIILHDFIKIIAEYHAWQDGSMVGQTNCHRRYMVAPFAAQRFSFV